MMSFKAAFLFASLCASHAHASKQARDLDEVTLLQASVQAEAQLQETVEQPSSAKAEPTEYGLADSLACESKEAATFKIPADVEPISPVAAFRERLRPLRLTPEAESGDPAGAGVLRAILELMIIVIIFDGLRRWRQQKQAKTQTAAPRSPAKEQEAAAESAWIAMVNAASAGNAVGFQKALQSSPSVSRTDTWGCTPLHFAAAGGSAAITEELLTRGVQVDHMDASDETPLHLAARAGHAAICELLLGAGADINAVNVQDMTPLVVAGHANQEPACRLLADHGAGVAGLTDEQLPPLVVSQLVRKVFEA